MRGQLSGIEHKGASRAIAQNPRAFADRIMRELHPNYGASPCTKGKKEQMVLHMLAGRAFQRIGVTDIRECLRASEEFDWAARIAAQLSEGNPASGYALLSAKYQRLAAEIYCQTCLQILTEYKGRGALWHGNMGGYWAKQGGQRLFEEAARSHLKVADARKKPSQRERLFFQAALCFLRARCFEDATAALERVRETGPRVKIREGVFRDRRAFEEARIRIEMEQETQYWRWKQGGLPLHSVLIDSGGSVSMIESLPALPMGWAMGLR